MKYINLDMHAIRGISRQGGTILRSTNKGRFAGKVGLGSNNEIPVEILQLAADNLRKLEIDTIIVIGGDGTLSAAVQLEKYGIKIVGVPKTIDNDLSCTDRTFGYNTAVDVIVDALGRLHSTAESHERVFVVETMGRYTGWLALEGGLGGIANAILIPEVPFSYKALYEFIMERRAKGRPHAIIVVAEGAKAIDDEISHWTDKSRPEAMLGGVAEKIAARLAEMSKDEFEIRTLVLGHLQRGGTPNSADMILAQSYGAAAVRAVHEGKFGQMVALTGNKITTIKISDAVAQLKIVTKDCMAYQTAESIGIFMGE
jgi:6-phosphofructokinase 1